MRIDAHQHFWDLNRFPYPWMPPPPSPLRRNFLPEDLQPILERNSFDGSIVVQATTSSEEAPWLLRLAETHSMVLGVVAWVDLTDPQLGRTLDQLQTHPKFKGVRHPVHDESDDQWLLRSDVLRGLMELERRKIPYDLLLRPQHLPVVIQLIDRVPSLAMVIDHISKPPIAKAQATCWAQDMERLAKAQQIHVKLSGMITEADWNSWTSDQLKPYVQHVWNLFGPDRCMFGSDWPVCLSAGTWKEVLAAFTQALGPVPQAERNKAMGETAAHFYKLHSA
jgi:L-fucono-1,5-lactonase